MINERVLLVDDEPRVGSSYARALRNVVKLEQASSAEEALSVLADSGAVAVVVSDMRMARMDGVDLLQRLIEHHPDTTRIMLTGNIDQRTAVRAVNEGGVFRYLTKPCDARVFGQAVLAGIQRYQIRRAEREMLDCPTDGAGEVARELLRLINPPAVKRIDPLTNLLKGMLDQAGAPRTPHDDEIAPLALLGAGAPGGAASAGDAKDSVDFADLSHRLASTVPTLVPVAKALRYQRKNFDGTGHPRDEIKGSALPMLSRVLRVALTFDQQVVQTQSQDDAFEALLQTPAYFDHGLLCALARHLDLPEPAEQVLDQGIGTLLHVRRLTAGMVLAESVVSKAGAVLMSADKELDEYAIERLQAFAERAQIPEEIRVLVPEEDEEDEIAQSA